MIVLLSVIPGYSLAILLWIFSKKASWNVIVACNKFFFRLFKISLHIEFKAEIDDLLHGGVIVGLNNESVIDPMVGMVASPVLLKSFFNIEYALIPFIGWISWLFGYVIVRQWPAQSRRKILKAITYLRKGGYVFLSIEGQRTKDGALNAYKKGAVVLAIMAQTSIIPIVLHGSRRCMPYGSWKIQPGIIQVRILPPIHTKGMTYDDRETLIRALRSIAERELSTIKAEQV